MIPPDTAQRSLEHWSKAGRAEMQTFYALTPGTVARLRARQREMLEAEADAAVGFQSLESPATATQ